MMMLIRLVMNPLQRGHSPTPDPRLRQAVEPEKCTRASVSREETLWVSSTFCVPYTFRIIMNHDFSHIAAASFFNGDRH